MILTPANWNTALAPTESWQNAYAYVTEGVQWLFGSEPDDAPARQFTTAQLVEALYPETWARGEGITARKRIFGALKALSTHQLADYCDKGEPRPLKHNKNRLVTPLIWHARKAKAEDADIQLIEQTLECMDWLGTGSDSDQAEADRVEAWAAWERLKVRLQ